MLVVNHLGDFKLFKSEIKSGQPQQAAFNSGFFKIERINALKNNLHKARVDDDIFSFEKLIYCYHSELIEFINKDDKQVDVIKKHFIKINNARDSDLSNKKKQIKSNEQELALHKLLLYLNQIENKYGLGMTTKSNILDEL